MVPLAVGLVVAFTIRDGWSTRRRPRRIPRWRGGFGFRSAFSLGRSLIVASFLVGVATTAIQSLLPLFGVAQGLSDEGAARLVAVFGLGEAVLVGVGRAACRPAMDRWQLLRFCAVPALLFAVAFPLAAAMIPALAVVLFVAGGTLGGIYTLGLILIGQDFRGQSLAVVATGFAMAYSAGAVVGSTPIGYLIDVFGPDALPPSRSRQACCSSPISSYVAIERTGRSERGRRLPSRTIVSPYHRSTRAKRSTSKRPKSVIFRCGMTGSARNATWRNGSSSVQPRLRAARAERYEARADRLERTEAHQTGERQGKLRKHFAA